jgi:hypothetical protein
MASSSECTGPISERRAGRSRPRRPPRGPCSPAPVQVTAHDGTITHYVTDPQVAAMTHSQRPQALCGHTFAPAGLTVPPGPLCPLCVAVQSAPSA